jgi:nucleoside-diphosphate-sugar epimerase
MIGYAKVNSEKLLIVGCGDLGQRLAARLAPEGYAITGVRRQPPENTNDVTYVAGDTADASSLKAIVSEGFDVIVVTMTPSERGDEGYRQAYVQTCQHLVAGLKATAQKPRLLLYVSSTGVYGQSEGEWVDESSPTEPKRDSGRRLLEAEGIITKSGLPHCIVRFSGIYGPGRNRFVEQVRQGRATLSARYTNRIHSEDCAGVMAHLIERQRQGKPIAPLYLASDCAPTPMAEVVNWLSMQLRVNEARFAPEPKGRGKRCLNRRLRDSGYEFQYPDYRAGYTALLAQEGR